MVGYMLLLDSFHRRRKRYLSANSIMKISNENMDLNRETAMRLWNKSFGKNTKAIDFAGRTMAKGAYNDRNSEFGWNVDHILPQSKGGATADYNLVCCHISTNDEKADRFPCFNANGIAFEIVKVQNHYEIRAKDEEHPNESLNYYDSASGIRFFKTLKRIQSKERFVGTVFIKLREITNTAVIDFIDCMLEKEYVSVESCFTRRRDVVIIARNNYMPLKGDVAGLLDKCVLLNTYLGGYFEPRGYVKGFDIYFRIDAFDDNFSMYENLDVVNSDAVSHANYHNSLFVNDLVLENTEAGDKVTRKANSEYTEYNFVLTKLSENLKKEVNGK